MLVVPSCGSDKPLEFELWVPVCDQKSCAADFGVSCSGSKVRNLMPLVELAIEARPCSTSGLRQLSGDHVKFLFVRVNDQAPVKKGIMRSKL
jgi:hypothetical protein